MPRIEPYQLRSSVPGPVETRRPTAEDYGAGVARGVQDLGRAMGDMSAALARREQQKEISDLHVKFSEAQAEFVKKLETEAQQGTLDDEKFLEDYDKFTESLGEGISTQAGQLFYNQQRANQRSQFAIAALKERMALAGVQAREKHVQARDALSSTLQQSPSQFESAVAMNDAAIDALVATEGLPATAAAQLKREDQAIFAENAVRGWIRLNPEDAKAQLSEGKWDTFVGGDLKKQLYGEAEQAITAKRIEQERLKREAEEALQLQREATQNDFLAKLAEGKLTTKDVLESNLEAFGSGSKNQFIQMLEEETRNGKRIKTDPATFIGLWDRIHLQDGDPKALRDENELNGYLGRGLTVQDINTLRGEIQGKKTIAGSIESELKNGVMQIAKSKLTKSNPLLGIRDPVGDEQMQKFTTFFLVEYAEQRKKGKTPQELLDPESKDYLGKHVERFTRTPQQIIQDSVKSIRPSASEKKVEPRKPGESAADYLKRIGQ